MEHCQTPAYLSDLLASCSRVKFLCSIADTYEFICPALPVYYDPVTYQPTFLIDRLHQEYRADFLIRNRKTSEAILIDLVPQSLSSDPRLSIRRQVAQNYISWKGYDWQYKIVIEEEIRLSASQVLQVASFLQMKDDTAGAKWITGFLSSIQEEKPIPFLHPEYSLLDFLIHGIVPAPIKRFTLC